MKGKFALVIAFLLAVIAVVAVKMYLENVKQEAEDKMVPVEVLCANRPLTAGTVLSAGDIGTMKIPLSMLSDDFYEADQASLLKGLRLSQSMKKDRPFLKSMWGGLGTEDAKVIDDDTYRAITIGVDKISGVGNLITEGSEVDVYCTYTVTPEAGSSAQNMKTIPLLSNVYVVRTDKSGASRAKSSKLFSQKSGGGGADTYSVVTVKVKPDEVPLLTYAQKKGELTLVLRKKSSLDRAIGSPVDNGSFEADVRKALIGRGSNPK